MSHYYKTRSKSLRDVKKPDEWISVSSPRLRPAGTGPVKQNAATEEIDPVVTPKEEIKETKPEVKGKVTYTVGERCLARWRDNRRFMATIQNDLGDGKYEIIFDDGCVWSCAANRLYKLKPSLKDELIVDTNLPASPSTPSPGQYGTGPGTTQLPPHLPAYHTHLFDPTRDYLGSKSERRERKRKLNIKEIFNIGQKKAKVQKTAKEATPKKPVEKKPKNVKSQMRLKPEIEVKMEIKTENTAADAVASIIGTTHNLIPPKVEINEHLLEPKKEVVPESELAGSGGIKDKDDIDIKADLGQTSDEDVRLEKFDNTDEEHNKEVLAMMKEVINKLENDIQQNQIRARNSPKPEIKVILPRLKLPSNHDGISPRSNIVTESRSRKSYVSDITESENLVNVMEVTKPDVTESKPDIKGFKSENVESNASDIKPDYYNVESKLEIIEHELNVKTTSDVIEHKSKVAELEPDAKEPILEIITVNPDDAEPEGIHKSENDEKDIPKKLSKVKKGKKLRLLQEKKVKKQVEKVKNELEEMKRQMEEMRKEMLSKTQALTTDKSGMMPESFLLPGEWCCKWVNGQPVGAVSEIEVEPKPEHSACDKPPLPRRSVQVEDKRLPPGWTKHMVRRSFGNSAGKWDVVLVNPDNRRFHTKSEMRIYLESHPDKGLQDYQYALMDFGVHLKLARRMGWITQTPDGATDGPTAPIPIGLMESTSPLVKRKKLSLKRKIIREGSKGNKQNRPRLTLKMKIPRPAEGYSAEGATSVTPDAPTFDSSTIEDGYVYVGSLKVEIIENLLRCPAEGCFKNFRNHTLLQMHIKHYHRELRKMMGATPKVLDLAYARTKTVPAEAEIRNSELKTIKVKLPRPLKRDEPKLEFKTELPETPTSRDIQRLIPRSQDSPKLRQALNKIVKRPKVLLPVRRPDPEQGIPDDNDDDDFEEPAESLEMPSEPLDFETAISTHTVTRPVLDKKRKGDKKRKTFALQSSRPFSEEEDWMTMNSDVDTMSSLPGSGTPDSKPDAKPGPVSSESYEDRDANMYAFNENGERIKIVHMKREEIINCHCGVREEDGLMVQCELCLCWQHALCHNIQREADVPEKYTCSICLNPRRGRRSKRFVHDQDRMYEGLLPGAKPCETLRRSHELSGNLLRIDDALHALTVNYYVATKKDHPKLYLWAKDWEQLQLQYTQEKLNSDYSDLNIMISSIDKENLPLKQEDVKDMHMDLASPPSEEHDRYSQRENHLGSQALLSGLLSSPSGVSLDLPISTSELERLAKSVEEQAMDRSGPPVGAPQPEAAIENSVCRARLLKHIQRCHALIDARLDSIEAQVAELESQDPSFEDDETAEYFPRTKQTVQMLMRDLDTMEELGVIT